MRGAGGDVTASDPARFTRSGFLTDYARLQPTAWGQGVECWREPNLNARRYNKVYVPHIVVSIAPSKGDDVAATVDPTDLKTLTDYFQDALVRALKPQMQVVNGGRTRTC